MRYSLPRFRIATMAPPQQRLVSKIGGLPWGLPPELWPSCCGRPQKLLAQLSHEPPMLDLGMDGAVLHLFQCMQCLGIGPESGRAAFVLPRSALSDGLTTVDGCELPGDLGNPLIGEAFIEGWEQRDDGIPAERLSEFYSEESVRAIQGEFPHVEWYQPREMTKFGGTPRWTGSGPMGFPPPPFEFLFQMAGSFYMEGPPPAPDVVGCPVHRQTYANGRAAYVRSAKPSPGNQQLNAPWGVVHYSGDDHYWAEFTNLGSDGTLYAFIDRTDRPHNVRWFWNR